MELFSVLGINWPLLIAQIINFALLLAALSYFVYKPLLRLIDERRERVRKAMDDAAQVEQETRQLEARRQERLSEIDAEAGRLLGDAKKRADAMMNEALEKARTEADAMLTRAKNQIEQERTEALQELQSTVAKAVVSVSEAVLEREFTDKDQERILASAAKQLSPLLR
jgi:F-type H+-transporting ATPase subunit b